MAVQLLENWLLKEQGKNPNQVPSLKSGFCCRTRHSFIGDSIVEYYPLQELFGTAKRLSIVEFEVIRQGCY